MLESPAGCWICGLFQNTVKVPVSCECGPDSFMRIIWGIMTFIAATPICFNIGKWLPAYISMSRERALDAVQGLIIRQVSLDIASHYEHDIDVEMILLVSQNSKERSVSKTTEGIA